MWSSLIPGLNSINSPTDELYSRIPASLVTVLHLPKQLLSLGANNLNNCSVFTDGLALLRREWSNFGGEGPLNWRELAILSVKIGVVITAVSIAWFYHLEEEGEEEENGGESPEPEAETASLVCYLNDEYAEDLQLEEVLWASLQSSHIADTPVFPSIRTSPKFNGEPSRILCRICFEEKTSWQMFKNQICCHSFCRDCTSKHIEAKVRDNAKKILCPEVNCKTRLDFNSCRQILPDDVLVKWGESLCKSLIPDSQKVYCPFLDCLAMLINDSGEVIRKINCPACRRLICASCCVPWHSEFSCEEFQRVNGKKKGKDEEFVKELAKKKSWRKCPSCHVYVEKTEGCLHITCRCKYEFCYSCGSKWSHHSGGCRTSS